MTINYQRESVHNAAPESQYIPVNYYQEVPPSALAHSFAKTFMKNFAKVVFLLFLFALIVSTYPSKNLDALLFDSAIISIFLIVPVLMYSSVEADNTKKFFLNGIITEKKFLKKHHKN